MWLGIIGRERERTTDLATLLKGQLEDTEVMYLPPIETRPCLFNVALFAPAPEKCIIFTSPRGVRHFVDQIGLPTGRVVAIGLATAMYLESLGVKVWFRSKTETSEGLACELLPVLQAYDQAQSIKSILLQPTSDIAGRYLCDYFVNQGFEYHMVPIYETVSSRYFADELMSLYECPDFFVFYSPSGVDSWLEALKQVAWAVKDTFLPISIGPKTTARLKECGYTHIHEAASPHVQDLAQVIRDCLRSEKRGNKEI